MHKLALSGAVAIGDHLGDAEGERHAAARVDDEFEERDVLDDDDLLELIGDEEGDGLRSAAPVPRGNGGARTLPRSLAESAFLAAPTLDDGAYYAESVQSSQESSEEEGREEGAGVTSQGSAAAQSIAQAKAKLVVMMARNPKARTASTVRHSQGAGTASVGPVQSGGKRAREPLEGPRARGQPAADVRRPAPGPPRSLTISIGTQWSPQPAVAAAASSGRAASTPLAEENGPTRPCSPV